MAYKARIWWTEEEKHQLVNEAVRIIKNDPTLKPLLALRKAQEQLPAARRRDISGGTPFKNIVADIDQALRITSGPETIPIIPGQVLKVEVRVPADPADVLGNTPTSLLIANVAERFFHWVDQLERLWAARTGREIPISPEPARAPRYPKARLPEADRLPRVAVIGLFKDQFDRIHQRVNGRLELIFIDKEWSKSTIPPSTDYVIVTRHVRHKWTEAAKAAMPRDRIFWADGAGDSAVMDRLHNLMQEATKIFK